jgi:hypothetical protein
VKIGVLSDGVTNLAASQALGDLGPVTVLPGQTGSGDEGTAMLEIIHDVAPGAQLYFATAFSGITNFARNIRDLRAAGCDIIVDDVFYFVETPFQDGQAPGVLSTTNGGVVIQAVKDVTAAGALYFSSAGNSGNLDDHTAGVWEGDFVDGGGTGVPLPTGNRLHNFGGQNFDVLTVPPTNNTINLSWSDPLGGSTNDYDLFRLNAAGTTVLASSTNIQNGTQDPYEQVPAGAAGGVRLVIVKKAAAAGRYLHLNSNRGRLSIATAGQTHGHAATSALGSFGVAATPAGAAFPNAFNSSDVVETFSSDGPRRIFFQPDGAPITPGNFSSTGGTLLTKPDITAADGVSVTGVGGFPNPFSGTSAAAPHAAAIAGLIKSANPSFTTEQIRAALETSAIDIESPGVDRDSGAGIVMAYNALQALGVTGTAFLTAGPLDFVATEHPGDGNGVINAGERAQVVARLRNLGVVAATGVTATLTTTTPGVTLTVPAQSTYPDIPAEIGSNVNTAPFLFTLASNAPCPQVVDFTLTATYADSPSPVTIPFQVQTGSTAISISSTLDSTPPDPSAAFTAITGTQIGRINRLSPASTCGTSKPFPGLNTTAGERQFDAYTFATCDTAPACVQVSLTNSALGANPALFDVAYVGEGEFDPANLAINYAGDPGASATGGQPISFSFTLPAGKQPFAVAVHEVNSGQGIGDNYSLTVSGACFGGCTTPNAVPVAKAKNVTVVADDSCSADASIDDGSSDADRDPLTITQSPPGPYPLGATTVLLTVTDPKGATSQTTATVTVVDTTAPSFSCPAPITRPTAPGTCSALVAFALPTPVEACSLPVTIGSSPAPGSLFPLGVTQVAVTGTDLAENSATCSFAVTVVDKEPPSVSSFSLTAPPLWPPNHQMVDVTANYGLSDNCDPGSCVLSVTSNEPENGLGDGDTDHDWEIVDARHLRVRAERSGNGNGRVYTVTLTCTDAAGNQTVRIGTLTVPHNP